MPTRHVVWAGALVLALAAIWGYQYPAGIDLPQHANLFRTLADLRTPGLGRLPYYQIDFFTPYALTYALGAGLTAIVGALAACKVLLSISVIATPVALRGWLRATGGDESLALWAFVGVFGFGYVWGFISFVLSAPVCLWYLTEVARVRAGEHRRTWWAALSGVTLFFTHGITFVFALCSAAAMLVMQRQPWRVVLAQGAHALPALALTLWWRLRQSEAAHAPIEYPADLSRLSLLFSGAFSHNPITWVSVMVALGLGVLVWQGKPRPNWSVAALVPVAFAMMGALSLPNTMFRTAFVGSRFVQFFWWFLPGVVRAGISQARRRVFLGLSVAFVAITLISTHVRLAVFNRELMGLEVLTEQIPRGATLKMIVTNADSAAFGQGAMNSSAAWASAERSAFFENDFGNYLQIPIRYRDGVARPSTYEYGLIRDVEASPRVFGADATRVASSGSFQLVRTDALRTQVTGFSIVSAGQQWGAMHLARSVDDKPMRVGGRVWLTGLGTHANSMIRLRSSEPPRTAFRGQCALDDEATPASPTYCEIIDEQNARLWRSDELKQGAAQSFEIELPKGDFFLKTSAIGSIAGAHTDWFWESK